MAIKRSWYYGANYITLQYDNVEYVAGNESQAKIVNPKITIGWGAGTTATTSYSIKLWDSGDGVFTGTEQQLSAKSVGGGNGGTQTWVGKTDLIVEPKAKSLGSSKQILTFGVSLYNLGLLNTGAETDYVIDVVYPRSSRGVGSIGPVDNDDRFLAGQNFEVAWSLPRTGSYAEVKYEYPGLVNAIVLTKIDGMTATLNIPVADLALKIPKATESTGKLYVDYWSDSEKGTYFGYDERKFVVVLPPSAGPTVGTPVISDTVLPGKLGTAAENNSLIRNISSLSLTNSGDAAFAGTTLTKVEFFLDNVLHGTTTPNTTYVIPSTSLTKAGTVKITKRITDSRGMVNEWSKDLTVLDVPRPSIKSFNVVRSPAGSTTLALNIDASVSSAKFNDVEKNALRYQWAVSATTTFPAYSTPPESVAAISFNGSKTISGTYVTTSIWHIRLRVFDKLDQEGVIVFTLPTDDVPLCLAEKGIGVGKMYQQGAVDAKGDIRVENGDYYKDGVPLGAIIMPTGSILMYPDSVCPNGWLWCDGTIYSKATSLNLFNLLKNRYGGDGTTTFAVPNLGGRVPVGRVGLGDDPFAVLGRTGGEETHELTWDEMPEHTHSTDIWYSGVKLATTTSGTWGNISGGETGSAGSGWEHNNLQPYITLNFIIKA